MRLRKLEMRDAALMLEWMHDETVVRDMGANFAEKTLADCECFIETSVRETENYHRAIADDGDQYMGTVSLKHICPEEKCAEFAIVVRKCAMGRGFSAFGMREMLSTGFERLGLQTIYWCVSRENSRAIAFYEKQGAERLLKAPNAAQGFYSEAQCAALDWYAARPNALGAGRKEDS